MGDEKRAFELLATVTPSLALYLIQQQLSDTGIKWF
jgi:hypothetical protein